MIKENKKNKIITFLCACLMVCASALGLVNAVGTTLASSPTQPTITTDYFNYNSSNYLDLFDGVFEGITPYTFGTFVSQEHFFPSSADCRFRILSGGHTFDYYSSNHFVYYYNNNTIYSSSPYYTTDNGDYYTFLLSPPFNNAEFVNNPELLDFKQDLFVIVIYGDDGIYRTYCSKTAYDYNQVYLNGQNNVINNPSAFGLYTLAQYQQNYTNGQNSVVNNPSAFGLYTQSQYQQNYSNGYYDGILQGQNNVIENPNNFGLNTNQQLQDSYNQGFADGEQTTEGYQNGFNDGKNDVLNNPNNYNLYTQSQYQQNYTDGQNSVVNNPNNYGLYTQAQYEQNYTDGYNKGLTYARYGIFSDITPIVKYGHISANTVIENPFSYYLNGLVFSDNVISMFPPNDYESGIMTVDINFNNDFVYTNDDFLKFFLPQTRVANVEYNLIDINNNVYTYVSSVETTGSTSEDRVTIFTNGPKTVDGSYVTGPVPSGSIIKQLSFVLINPEYYGLTQFYFHQIDNGYDLGYTTGFDQGFKNGVTVGGHESYQTGYNNGSVDGFNSGYAQGLANQDNATFSSMISAVIDVPINAMRNLFNFELLGINLFGFFTALFTLLVVITIVRLILGGK